MNMVNDVWQMVNTTVVSEGWLSRVALVENRTSRHLKGTGRYCNIREGVFSCMYLGIILNHQRWPRTWIGNCPGGGRKVEFGSKIVVSMVTLT